MKREIYKEEKRERENSDKRCLEWFNLCFEKIALACGKVKPTW